MTDFGPRLVELCKARGHGLLIMKLAAALGVSTDELLGFAGKEPAVQPAVKDRRLWRRSTASDRLSKRDRAALMRTIDAFSPRPRRGSTIAAPGFQEGRVCRRNDRG